MKSPRMHHMVQISLTANSAVSSTAWDVTGKSGRCSYNRRPNCGLSASACFNGIWCSSPRSSRQCDHTHPSCGYGAEDSIVSLGPVMGIRMLWIRPSYGSRAPLPLPFGSAERGISDPSRKTLSFLLFAVSCQEGEPGSCLALQAAHSRLRWGSAPTLPWPYQRLLDRGECP